MPDAIRMAEIVAVQVQYDERWAGAIERYIGTDPAQLGLYLGPLVADWTKPRE